MGYWKNTEDLRKNWGVGKTWKPSADESLRTKNYRMWKKALSRTFDWME